MRPKFFGRTILAYTLVLGLLFAAFAIKAGGGSCDDISHGIKVGSDMIAASLGGLQIIILGFLAKKLSHHQKDGLGIKTELRW
jgi:hypothetical protein